MPRLIVQKVTRPEDRDLPIFDEIDEVAERIRVRAYSLAKRRGLGEGHDLDDWLTAEREICWPSAELVEEDELFTLKVALAGFEVDDISITATPTELIIKAARESSEEETSDTEEARIRWSELRSDDVYRRIELPTTVDVENVTALLRNGMLEIEAPKAEIEEQTQSEVEVTTE